MAITRGQTAKQLEPGLGNGWTKANRAQFKKVCLKTHGKIYQPNSKKPKVFKV
tara:strand:+ start:12 stop:170 length:159 start_codon:yes stop_codon:yes gene_type:complete